MEIRISKNIWQQEYMMWSEENILEDFSRGGQSQRKTANYYKRRTHRCTLCSIILIIRWDGYPTRVRAIKCRTVCFLCSPRRLANSELLFHYNQKKIHNTFWPDLNFEPETSCRCIVDCDIVSRSDKCLIWVVLCFSSVQAIHCINVFFYTMSEFKSIIIINIHYSIT